MDTLLIFFLNRSFLDIVEKNQKPVFKIREFLTFLNIIILNGAQNFKLFFKHFLGYKYEIRLGLILRKREDQALISISTILKFSALKKKHFLEHAKKRANTFP